MGAFGLSGGAKFARGCGGTVFSSTAADKPDGADHLITYRLTGSGFAAPTFALLWEDLPASKSDLDYNDLAVELTFAATADGLGRRPAARGRVDRALDARRGWARCRWT